ncbi:MAG: MOSC domain-containing protein, partial [Veillonella sp.]|nr:MOSC domain-containing protein [Veillonella sp.]
MAEGKIIAISISERKGQKKHNIESANLIVDHGMEGDA